MPRSQRHAVTAPSLMRQAWLLVRSRAVYLTKDSAIWIAIRPEYALYLTRTILNFMVLLPEKLPLPFTMSFAVPTRLLFLYESLQSDVSGSRYWDSARRTDRLVTRLRGVPPPSPMCHDQLAHGVPHRVLVRNGLALMTACPSYANSWSNVTTLAKTPLYSLYASPYVVISVLWMAVFGDTMPMSSSCR